MALHCELCGSRADGAERLGRYCPGEYCGTDLRAGADAGVRAWCEPPRRFGTAGGTVLLDLLVHNDGPQPTGFRVEPVEPVQGRLEFDRRAAEAPLPPGTTRRIELRYVVPLDLVALGPDIASRFGVPGAGAAGQVQGGRHARAGVALRVSATSARQGAACAAFAVDVRDGTWPTPDSGEPYGGGLDDRQPPHGQPPSPARPRRDDRRTGGCGPLAAAVLVAVVAVLGGGPGAAARRSR
ncbi:hypothetical protein ABT093_12035 [Kitasatospora sp. NPDC002551]|uniref:hypothetical protein n=1 Tax=unclassified Kitasatospora TaxID=2633591 RepID=UPI0033177731